MIYPLNHLPNLYSIMYWGNTFVDTLHKANVTCQKAFHSIGNTARAHSSAELQPAPFRMLHHKSVSWSGPRAMQRMWRMKVETTGYRMIRLLVQSLLKQHSKVSPNDPSREKSSRVLRGKMLWMWVCDRPNVVEDTIINKDWADTHQRWQRLFQLCDNESFFFFPFIYLFSFTSLLQWGCATFFIKKILLYFSLLILYMYAIYFVNSSPLLSDTSQHIPFWLHVAHLSLSDFFFILVVH